LDLATLEEIEQRSGTDHRFERYSLKLVRFRRAVTGSPSLPSGFASAPFSVMATAPASPAFNTSSRRTSIVRCSPGCMRRSTVGSPSTVVETQHARVADNATVNRSGLAAVADGASAARAADD